MVTKRRTYLIHDPYDSDAVEFIGAMERYFQLRPVCLYTDRKKRYYGERHFPALRGDRVEDRIDLDGRDLRSVAADLRERYDVVAIVPFSELYIEPAAELCGLLDLSWNAPDTLRLFRDKAALRNHLRSVAPDVRVPDHRLVTSVEDFLDGPRPPRFVLKPNDGMGNVSIGIFDAAQEAEAIAHIERRPGTTWILDEFIGGREYHVNGQVRSGGEVTTLAVIEYLRTEVNGYPTVYLGELQVHTDEPVFDQAVRYAARLLQATGLERCPFHMEIKVDGSGPCVIDLGARIGSDGTARTVSALHPNRPDVYAVAAHDYLGLNDFATGPLDWAHHDKYRTVYAYGIAESAGMIETLTGIEELERRSDFVRWVSKPRIGDALRVTRDLRSTPYIVELCIEGDRAEACRVIDEVRSTVRWNTDRSRVSRALAHKAAIRRKIPGRVAWLAHRAGVMG